jgi:hypothetical protein
VILSEMECVIAYPNSVEDCPLSEIYLIHTVHGTYQAYWALDSDQNKYGVMNRPLLQIFREMLLVTSCKLEW